MRTDDDIVEIGPIRAERSFVIGAFIQVVPGDGIQLRLGRFGKVEDIYLFQQSIAQLTEFLLGLQQRGRGEELTKPADCLTSGHRVHEYHTFSGRSMIDRNRGLWFQKINLTRFLLSRGLNSSGV